MDKLAQLKNVNSLYKVASSIQHLESLPLDNNHRWSYNLDLVHYNSNIIKCT
jgi:hypothetical protein